MIDHASVIQKLMASVQDSSLILMALDELKLLKPAKLILLDGRDSSEGSFHLSCVAGIELLGVASPLGRRALCSFLGLCSLLGLPFD